MFSPTLIICWLFFPPLIQQDFFKYFFLFTYLAALGLNCGVQILSAYGIWMPEQESNPDFLFWELGVLATPREVPFFHFFLWLSFFYTLWCCWILYLLSKWNAPFYYLTYFAVNSTVCSAFYLEFCYFTVLSSFMLLFVVCHLFASVPTCPICLCPSFKGGVDKQCGDKIGLPIHRCQKAPF